MNTTFFPKSPTTFLKCFRGERRKYAEKKVCHNQVESDMFTTKPLGWARLTWVDTLCRCFNSLPHMQILGSSNSAANKDMMSKIWQNGNTVI